MKSVWTILCSVVLVLSQFASLATVTHSSLPCPCCSCTQISCCATAPAPVATPVAAQSDSRSYTAPPVTVVSLIALPISTPYPESFSLVPGFSPHRSAIYDRNCSYLL